MGATAAVGPSPLDERFRCPGSASPPSGSGTAWPSCACPNSTPLPARLLAAATTAHAGQLHPPQQLTQTSHHLLPFL